MASNEPQTLQSSTIVTPRNNAADTSKSVAFANIIASRNKNDDANLGAKRSSFDPTKHVPPKISSFGFNVFPSPKDAGR